MKFCITDTRIRNKKNLHVHSYTCIYVISLLKYVYIQLSNMYESCFTFFVQEFDGSFDSVSPALTCAFNRTGSLLAVGCNDGRLVIWDFLTRGIAKILVAHVHPVSSVRLVLYKLQHVKIQFFIGFYNNMLIYISHSPVLEIFKMITHKTFKFWYIR